MSLIYIEVLKSYGMLKLSLEIILKTIVKIFLILRN